MAKTYDLLIRARGEGRDAERAMKQLQRQVRGFGDSMQRVGRNLTAGVTLPIVAMGAVGVRELNDMQKATAQTNAVLKSTGGAAGVTAKHVEQLSNELLKVSGVDDQVIQGGQNILLTFTKIGAKGGVFDRATKAALDLSVAFGKDMNSSAILVGKALQDPIKGITALGRVGVQLSERQKKQIKRFVELGETAKAQKVILRELETQVGGSAAAYGQTAAGAVGRLKEQFAGLSAQMVQMLLPAFQSIIGRLQTAMDWFSGLSERTKRLAGIGLVLAAALGPVLMVMGSLVSASAALVPVIAAISAPALGVAAAVAAVGVALVVAYRKSEKFRDVVDGALRGVLDGAVVVFTELRATLEVWVAWASAAWKKWGDDVKAVVVPTMRAVGTIIASNLRMIRDGIRLVMSLLRGDWRGAWDAIKSIVRNQMQAARNIAVALAEGLKAQVLLALRPLIGAVRGVWNSVRDGVAAGWELIRNTAKSWASSVKNAIVNAIDDLPAKFKSVGAEAGRALAGAIRSAVNAVISKWNDLEIPAIKVAGKEVTPAIGTPNLPLFARGGITSGPSIVGEAGPEAVVPLGSGMQARADRERVLGMLGLSSGGATVNVYASSADAEAIARRVAFIMGGSMLRSGGGI